MQITVIEGKLIRDTEIFGKMDPFFVIQHKGQQYKTKVFLKGGKNPIWNERFRFSIYSMEDDLKMTCFDEDLLSNDCVGVGWYNVSTLSAHGSGLRDWFPLYYNEVLSAQILIETKVLPVQKELLSVSISDIMPA